MSHPALLRRLVFIGCALFAVSLVAAGCGSSDDDTTGGGSGSGGGGGSATIALLLP